MAKNFNQPIQDLKVLRTDAYGLLLSSNATNNAIARPLIEECLTTAADIGALDLLDRIKKWIGNDGKAKKRSYLQKVHLDAMQYFGGPGIGTWRTMAYCARVFRYSGRFWKAQKAYNVAFSMIGDFGSYSDEDKFAIADVYADYAEFRAYLGHPGEADSILAMFPAGYLRAWHEWVRATAYHFWGYEDAQPFATPDSTNLPGPEAKYTDSNNFLATARAMTGPNKTLPPNEEMDTYLLEAANWGAICRRRKATGVGDPDDARDKAMEALDIFRGKGPDGDADVDPMNVLWSWEKERRGRLAIFFRRKLDGHLNRQDVEDWRRKFRNHYRENLKIAELPDAITPTEENPVEDEFLDGQLDDYDDHGDDEGD